MRTVDTTGFAYQLPPQSLSSEQTREGAAGQ